MTRLRRSTAAVVVGVAAIFLAACDGDTSPEPSLPQPSSTIASSPVSSGTQASDQAKEILERGVAHGGLTRLDLDLAAANAMECLENAGITPMFAAPAKPGALYSISW